MEIEEKDRNCWNCKFNTPKKCKDDYNSFVNGKCIRWEKKYQHNKKD